MAQCARHALQNSKRVRPTLATVEKNELQETSALGL